MKNLKDYTITTQMGKFVVTISDYGADGFEIEEITDLDGNDVSFDHMTYMGQDMYDFISALVQDEINTDNETTYAEED